MGNFLLGKLWRYVENIRHVVHRPVAVLPLTPTTPAPLPEHSEIACELRQLALVFDSADLLPKITSEGLGARSLQLRQQPLDALAADPKWLWVTRPDDEEPVADGMPTGAGGVSVFLVVDDLSGEVPGGGVGPHGLTDACSCGVSSHGASVRDRPDGFGAASTEAGRILYRRPCMT